MLRTAGASAARQLGLGVDEAIEVYRKLLEQKPTKKGGNDARR